MAETKNTTMRFNEETLEQLEEIRKELYPRAEDRSKVLRWLIEDTYNRLKGKEIPNG